MDAVTPTCDADSIFDERGWIILCVKGSIKISVPEDPSVAVCALTGGQFVVSVAGRYMYVDVLCGGVFCAV